MLAVRTNPQANLLRKKKKETYVVNELLFKSRSTSPNAQSPAAEPTYKDSKRSRWRLVGAAISRDFLDLANFREPKNYIFTDERTHERGRSLKKNAVHAARLKISLR